MAMLSSDSGAVTDYSFAKNSDDFLDKTLIFQIFAEGVLTGSNQIQRPTIADVPPLPQPPLLTESASTGSIRDPGITGDDLPLEQPEQLTGHKSPRQLKGKRSSEGSIRDPVIIGEDLPLEQTEHLTGNKSPRQLKRKREDATSAGENGQMNVSKGDGDSLVAPLRVKIIKVAGVILAGRSEYFQTLFTTKMRGGDIQTEFTLKISEKEEPAVEQLMDFFYTNKVTTNDPELLIDTLTAADKFRVLNAVAYCSSLLKTIPMSTELAQLYLEVPSSSTVVNEALKDLRTASGQFLAKVFRDIKRSEASLLTMPLSVIIAIFSRSEIVVPSEEYVFFFLARWCYKQFDNMPERLDLLKTHIVPLVRFVHFTPDALMRVLSTKMMDQAKISKITMNALLYRSDMSNLHFPIENDKSMLERRIYTVKRIRSLNGDMPFHHCVVFVELNKEDIENLAVAPELTTEQFSVATHQFRLKMKIVEEPAGSGVPRFGISLASQNMQETCTIRYRFSFMRRPDEEYVSLHHFTAQFTGSMVLGHRDVFRIPWNQALTAGFLIDGSLYIKAEVRLVS